MKKILLSLLLVAFSASAQIVNPGASGPGARPSTFTNHGVLIGQGAANVTATTAGTSGLCLLSGGSTADPNWGSCSGGSAGTVTSVSVVSANGLAGSVATATTTPAITLSTSITGVLKGNGTAISAASSGTDYSLGTSALGTGIVKTTTGTGALSVAVAGDFPTLNQNTSGTAANVTGIVGIANGGTALSSTPTNGQIDIGNGTNFTRTTITPGTGITVTNGAGTITIAASSGPVGATYAWGDCSDGNVTVNSSVTLTRDMFYNNLTLGASAALNPGGYRIFVCGTLDLTAAPSLAINYSGSNGGNASGGTGGTASAASIAHELGIGAQGQSGVNGTVSSSNGTAGGNGISSNNGGNSAGAGAGGGDGTVFSGGAAGTQSAANTYKPSYWPSVLPGTSFAGLSFGVTNAGAGGASGGSGGNSAGTSGGSGAGGNGGNVISIFANTISRGTNANSSIINASGGTGGNGAAGAGGGGGGGGSGGGGGYVLIGYATLTGSAITNAIEISGGAGGAGGNGSSPALGGDGGGSGGSGTVLMYNTSASTMTPTTPVAGTTGTVHSGSTGGAGRTKNTKFVSL